MQVGDLIPSYVQANDYDTTKYPLAYFRDAALAPIGSPVALPHLGNGFYGLASVPMPNSPWVAVQYVFYDDIGHTILSTSEGGSLDVFELGSGLAVGDPMPLLNQIFDYASDVFPLAYIRDDATLPAPGTPVILTHVALGLYANITVPLPSSLFMSAQFVVYDDSGHTVVSGSDGGSMGIIFQEGSPLSSFPSDTGLVGIIDSLLVNPINGLQDVLVTNSDRVLNVRIARNDTGDPFNLAGTTLLQFRFLNFDDTVTVITGAVTSAGGGKASCVITKAQSSLFKPMNPSPFSVVVTQTGGQTVCNFPYQLEIQAEINP